MPTMRDSVVKKKMPTGQSLIEYCERNNIRFNLVSEREALCERWCDWIKNGGTLQAWSKKNGVTFGDMMAVIGAFPVLKERVNAAKEVRREFVNELFVEQLKSIASTDIRELFKEDGTAKEPKDWSDELGAQVKSVQFDKVTGNITKVEVWSKPAGLKLLGDSLGITRPKVDDTMSALAKVLERRTERDKEITDG